MKNQGKTSKKIGGKREGAGRPKGALNKNTAAIRALAQEYGPECIKLLYEIAQSSDVGASRIAAIKELLDRGYGKSTAIQEISGPNGSPLHSAPPLIIQPIGSPEE